MLNAAQSTDLAVQLRKEKRGGQMLQPTLPEFLVVDMQAPAEEIAHVRNMLDG